ncbi:uncharacterized protein LOC143600337 [Bidens hawaiensis]|uniref:uncharacterized protein LOC143600337 n=1 Tax=Bidens hawaiensis TaxID=980011 RepID=UPI0040492774
MIERHTDGSLAMLTVDFSNAFNMVDRSALLHEVRIRCPSISLWVEFLYGQPSRLYLGDDNIWSTTGVQQGDPLGPLLFSLVLHPLVHQIRNNCKLLLHAWYLDDGTVIGDSMEVAKVLDIIKVTGPTLGLELNIKKTELFWPSCDGTKSRDDLFPADIGRPLLGVKLLGGAVSKDTGFIKVASSKLQTKVDRFHDLLSTFPVPTEPVKNVEMPPVHDLIDEPVDIEVDGFFGETKFVGEMLDDDMKIAKEAYEERERNRVNKSVISMSAWTPSDVNQVGLCSPVEKPPASARFSHRKPVKAVPEVGKALGVAKPKRQDTLETTWKTITEGRSVPLTRHLRKSDTWETREKRTSDEFLTNNNNVNINNIHSDRMSKSETFDVNRSRKPAKPPAPQSKLNRTGGLKKEPSLGQEELNRRVEAFIKKFNEDMRLQRQESLNQYMEMINRGAH